MAGKWNPKIFVYIRFSVDISNVLYGLSFSDIVDTFTKYKIDQRDNKLTVQFNSS